MTRKRKPGAGKKPKGDFSNLTAPLTIRMPADMRAELEAAAKRDGKSLTQKLLRRLNDAAKLERDRARDPASRALCYLLAETIEVVKSNTTMEWRSDPFTFRAIQLAFNQIMESLQPPGDIIAPKVEPSFDSPAVLRGFVFAETPDKMAEGTAGLVLLHLHRNIEHATDQTEPLATVARTAARSTIEFGMLDASRELLRKGKKR